MNIDTLMQQNFNFLSKKEALHLIYILMDRRFDKNNLNILLEHILKFEAVSAYGFSFRILNNNIENIKEIVIINNYNNTDLLLKFSFNKNLSGDIENTIINN